MLKKITIELYYCNKSIVKMKYWAFFLKQQMLKY